MTSPSLHLGAFDRSIQGWTNTDITPHLFIAHVPLLARALFVAGLMDRRRLAQHQRGVFKDVKHLNVARRFPFPDGSFQFIYSSHVLEHLHPSTAQHCLLECKRVLVPGCVIRTAVPDLDDIVGSYNPDDPKTTLDLIFELGSRSSKNRHWWHYNEVSLVQVLLKSGFREAYRCEYGLSHYDCLAGIDTRPGSLIVEAVK